MEPNRVIANLNKKVMYTGQRSDLRNKEYILTGATIRKTKDDAAYYQAELSEVGSRALVICKLSEIE